MADELGDGAVDTLTLRFIGEDENGNSTHELRAADVVEVLQGVVGITSDFDKAGVFNPEGPGQSEVFVRPAQEGSFILEVFRFIAENRDAVTTGATVFGVPSLSTVIWWATKSIRADVKDFDYLDNGNVKICWQDDTVDEVPRAAWDELNKRKRRRKKQLRQIMAPLSDPNVSTLDVTGTSEGEDTADEVPATFELTQDDYAVAKPDDEIEETQEFFEVEAQMSAVDFDDPAKWRVKTKDGKRTVRVEDHEFLSEVARGMAIRKSDVFRIKVREDTTKKNGRTRTTWTILQVMEHRRAASDDS